MTMTSPQKRQRTVVVVGAGIVGMSAARYLQRDGAQVTVLDPLALGRGASFGNAGGIAVSEVTPLALPGIMRRVPGWLMDPLGPLAIRWSYLPRLAPWLWRFWRASARERVEAAADALAGLLAHVYDDYEPLLAEAGIRDILRRQGCISLYESEGALRHDALAWELKRARGVRIEHLGPEELRQMEPDIAPIFKAGMFVPDWGHVADPHRVVLGIAESFQRLGGTIKEARAMAFEIAAEGPRALRTESGERIAFDQLVIAAGAWSGKLAKPLGSRVPLETERGYHTTLPRPNVTVNRMLHSAEGGFVLTPMAMGLRLSGTVELGGLELPPNYARARILATRAKRLLPRLNAEGGTEWMGFRPSLPDSLPVISRSPHFANLFYAFGHGHLGLTEGPTTGRIIACLAGGRDPGLDLKPFRVDRF
ncbi:MAG: NAD(P)/FAD-dependent oxidoreductase [Alphaproteobacteria bacterium]